MKKLKIVLLYGGESSEREISINTGNNVSEALEELGHSVTKIDISDKDSLLQIYSKKFDLAYLALHGKGGEDGSIQGFLDTLNIPYIGSNVLASAVAMNKTTAKSCYSFNNIPTAPFVVVNRDNDFKPEDIINKLGQHLVVKAANEGSSIGLYITNNKEELLSAIKNAFKLDKEVVIEKYISGKEYTIAILELPEEDKSKYKEEVMFNNLLALPVVHIIPKNDFYDISSKYDKGGSQHICPANISPEISNNMRKLALKAHSVLGCSGISRSDFIVDKNDYPYILETNSLPGMTKTSLFPDSCRSIGISFNELCQYIIAAGLKKYI